MIFLSPAPFHPHCLSHEPRCSRWSLAVFCLEPDPVGGGGTLPSYKTILNSGVFLLEKTLKKWRWRCERCGYKMGPLSYKSTSWVPKNGPYKWVSFFFTTKSLHPTKKTGDCGHIFFVGLSSIRLCINRIEHELYWLLPQAVFGPDEKKTAFFVGLTGESTEIPSLESLLTTFRV